MIHVACTRASRPDNISESDVTPHPRATVARMAGYTPGEQPRRGRVVKLNTNENPFPPSPQVFEAIRSIGGDALRRYPNPTADAFRDAAAKAARRVARHDPRGQRQRRHPARSPRARFFGPAACSPARPDVLALPRAGAAGRTCGSSSVPWEQRLVAADRRTARDEGRRDLPRQPQRPDRHVRLAVGSRGTGRRRPSAGAGRRGVRRLRRRQLPGARDGARERRHLPHAQQGVRPGRAAVRLRGRAARR